ncbi:MAG: acyl carrier protein [Rhizobiales bacterium]|nr:acyl carrier protein [Hyphomicrobiales bacterium]
MSKLSLQLREIIAECITGCPVAPEEMTHEMTLVADLGCDSLDRIEMAMTLEEKFELRIDDEVIDQFESVGDIVTYIDGRVSA